MKYNNHTVVFRLSLRDVFGKIRKMFTTDICLSQLSSPRQEMCLTLSRNTVHINHQATLSHLKHSPNNVPTQDTKKPQFTLSRHNTLKMRNQTPNNPPPPQWFYCGQEGVRSVVDCPTSHVTLPAIYLVKPPRGASPSRPPIAAGTD